MLSVLDFAFGALYGLNRWPGIVVLAVSLSISLAPLAYAADTDEDIVTLPANMQFRTFDKKVLGFNSPMGISQRTGGNYASDKLLDGAEKLPVGALRYPGGTVANFFNWQKQILDSKMIEEVGKPRMLSLLQTDRARNKGGLTYVSLASFFQASEILDSRPFIVPNLLTMS